MPKIIKPIIWETGSNLRPDVQQQCLARFVHRFTHDHKPAWTRQPWKDGKPYPVQFASDADWLANTWFAITTSGDLDGRVKQCESSPTWPENPELRKGKAEKAAA